MEMQEETLPNQLQHFFDQWSVIERQKRLAQENLTFEERLNQFLNEWRRVFIDVRKLSVFFSGYQPVLEAKQRARQQGFEANVWKAAGLKTDEVRNSQVLKWLLDWRGDHGQDNQLLRQFLKLLPSQFHKFELDRYIATAESCPLGNNENRVDIEIDDKQLLLFIEVKINATEGIDQLQRYADIATAKSGNRDWAVVYLTRNGKLPEKYRTSDRYIGISWQQVAEILNEYTKNADKENRGAWLIKQFADHIQSFK